MPKDDIERAVEWYTNRPLKRPSTNPKRIAKLLEMSKGKKAKPGPKSKKAKKQIRGAAPRKSGSGKKRKEKPAPAVVVTPLDMLNNAKEVAVEAHKLMKDTMTQGNDAMLSLRLGVHSKSIEAYFAAEEAYRKDLERRRELIPLSEAMSMYRKGFEFMLNRMKAFAQAKAAEANPENPVQAFTVIDRGLNEIIADTQKLYAP